MARSRFSPKRGRIVEARFDEPVYASDENMADVINLGFFWVSILGHFDPLCKQYGTGQHASRRKFINRALKKGSMSFRVEFECASEAGKR